MTQRTGRSPSHHANNTKTSISFSSFFLFHFDPQHPGFSSRDIYKHHITFTMAAQSEQIKNNFLNNPYAQQVLNVANGQVSALDAELNKYPILRQLEQQTKVPKAYGVIALGFSSVLLIFFNMFGLAQPISNLIGWALPAYLSILAIESPQANDDKQWLTYWVVFGSLNLVESMGLRAVLYWVPMYFVFKTLFTIWLMLPATRGAEILYFHFLRPMVGNVKSRSQASFGTSDPLAKEHSFNPAGTTAPSSFAHEKTL
ncbi:protein YOP1 [Cryptococcus neoformans]|nr:protein YOP1 [Cryptococcus neoformans var. grubii]OWZ77418.1 protein YOP1 [Cryptococcus neoformans var. grubii Bt85]OXG16233.1 protein YOP1 [Cryptococcus neoformans var. grubii Tu401-1]